MKNNVKLNNVVLIVVFFLFLIIIVRVSYIALAKKIDNIDIQSLASKRTTKEIILKANRGTIFDSSGDVLAQDVTSYTLIAYLDSKRTTDSDNPQHVVDKDKTALVLSAILNMDKETILSYLNKENTYQTEFGVKGKGLNEIEKDTILATNLPGLDFIETTKRYYPYGEFLSYLIGYAKQDDSGNIVGELGIEKYYNKELTGTDGKTVYQKDLRGYKIAGTKEITEDKIDGSDIYLTIDNNIQFFLEESLTDVSSKYEFDEIDIIVANAKTGEILGYATTPSFDPNVLDIDNYLDSNITAFEPGSTMKIYTYMAALEAEVYKGNDTYMSGSFETKDKTVIRDWNKVGWGRITYDKGFIYSSNTGVVNMMNKYLDADTLKNYLKKLGFGTKTDICLPNEASGKINFKYETEVFNAAFGQGITTTPIQHIKALTSIANDGDLLKPYIVKKIVSDETTTENKRTVLTNVASSETISYIKNLMWHTVNDPDGAAHAYYIEGYDLIGKTGTAQIASTNGKGYLTGDRDIIRSVSLLFPKDNPEIIIYAAAKRPESVKVLSEPVKEIVKNISKCYNLYKEQETSNENIITIDNYLNQDLEQATANLKENKITPIVIGSGKTIINQYPLNKTITSSDKVFLFTNSTDYVLPNLTGYSKSDVETLLTLLNVSYTIKGHGYVVKQSIPENTKITSDLKIEITLESRLKE